MTNQEAIEYWQNHEIVGDKEQNEAVDLAIRALRQAEERHTAKWESNVFKSHTKYTSTIIHGFTCSECHMFSHIKSKYCSECGSFMENWI